MCEDREIVVIDNGSRTTRAGITGGDSPKVVFPSIVGTLRQQIMLGFDSRKDYYVGEEVMRLRGVLTVKHPIERGIITKWDDMEKLWHHTFERLSVPPEEHGVLLTEPPLNLKSNREKMAEVMFEVFKLPLLHVATQALLALYASERSTGIVFDSGHCVTHTVPIYNNYIVTNATPNTHECVTGSEMTDWLQKKLFGRYSFVTNSPDTFSLLSDVKESLCYVSQDFEREMAQSDLIKKSYTLPDGQQFIMGSECIQCPELFFKPSNYHDHEGVHHLIHNAIMKCDQDIRQELYSNIILSGGNTMYPGMGERLQKEIKALAPPEMEVKVVTPTMSKFATWRGASKLATLPGFKELCISKREYEECGSAILDTKWQSKQ